MTFVSDEPCHARRATYSRSPKWRSASLMAATASGEPTPVGVLGHVGLGDPQRGATDGLAFRTARSL